VVGELVRLVGGMAVETGQAMQRAGLRLAGNRVIKQSAFNFVYPKKPNVVQGAYPALSSWIIGNVWVYPNTTVGERTVLRADDKEISIGVGCDIEDEVVIKGSTGRDHNGLPAKTEIANNVTVGSGSVLDACMIDGGVIIGKNCVISHGVFIGQKAELLDGTVVPPYHRIPEGQVWGGNPAKYVKEAEVKHIMGNVQ